MKIKDIPLSDRPRERLLKVGASSLSNEELLSIIIKTGTKERSAKMIALDVLNMVGGIEGVGKLNYNSIKKIKGIGHVKAIELLATIELSKRLNTSISSINNVKFTNPNIIYEYYKNTLAKEKQEHFYAIYLNNAKRVIKDVLLFKGTINHSLVHPREVFKEAYNCDATCIICVHNHPSGNVMPSREDLNITARLKEIGQLFNIAILDHIIVSESGYYSFYENGDI